MTTDIDKIRKLLSVAKSPKEKEMYQQILNKLEVLNPPKPPDKKPLTTSGTKISVRPKSLSQTIPKPNPDLKPQVNPMFQAIGILQGDITFSDSKAVIKLGDLEYPLYYLPNKKRKAYDALREEIEATGNPKQRVIVYPKVTHFPSKDEPYTLAFSLVGFVKPNESPKPGIEAQLKDFEFTLRGLWQFIPVCRTPCISIYKNFTTSRLDWLKEQEVYKQVRFMKGSHIPLLWKDSSVRPFRFNPKAEKSEDKPFFVALKAKFLPHRNVFAFIEELGQPLDKAPRFLKASKELKAEALRTKAISK